MEASALVNTERVSSEFPAGQRTLKCAVVIPCLNEAARIGNVVSSVRQFLPDVFVVDDGSADHTAQVAQESGARVLRHSVRKGKGAGLLTGCEAAFAAGFEYALTMDGDGQHAPEDIPAFLLCLRETRADMIVGNRMGHCGGMPLTRRFVNWWMSRRLSRVCGQPLPDTQCGYRLINLRAFLDLHLSTSKFELESEILLAFCAQGKRIEFVPVRVIYGDERSKINPLKDTWRWFRWFRRARKTFRA